MPTCLVPSRLGPVLICLTFCEVVFHCLRCPPCPLRPGIVPSMMFFSIEAWREMWPKYFSLRVFTIASSFLFWSTRFRSQHVPCMGSSYLFCNIASRKPQCCISNPWTGLIARLRHRGSIRSRARASHTGPRHWTSLQGIWASRLLRWGGGSKTQNGRFPCKFFSGC